jgi:rhodanese-related sulfurtransferase
VVGVILAMMNNDTRAPHPLRRTLRRPLRRLGVAVALVATLGTAAACSAAEEAGLSAIEALPANTMLIDVRTPAEFAEGHLDGAVNIPVELPTFAEQVALLDPDMDFLVYCRSGRRADVAIAYMDTLGMTSTNLGSVEAASSATGIRVVR